jgi:hypothetical protein
MQSSLTGQFEQILISKVDNHGQSLAGIPINSFGVIEHQHPFGELDDPLHIQELGVTDVYVEVVHFNMHPSGKNCELQMHK